MIYPVNAANHLRYFSELPRESPPDHGGVSEFGLTKYALTRSDRIMHGKLLHVVKYNLVKCLVSDKGF